MPTAAAVVFDLGNVLIPWDRRRLFERVFDDPAELDHFLDAVLTLEVNARLDRGTPLRDLCRDLRAEHPSHAVAIDAFEHRWIETIGPAIEGTVALLHELSERATDCFALSNWSSETFALARPRYPFLDRFRDIVISGDVGLVKPEPAIYELALERFGLAADQTVFIDDNAANIEVARTLGIDAIRFVDPVSLRAALHDRGLVDG